MFQTAYQNHSSKPYPQSKDYFRGPDKNKSGSPIQLFREKLILIKRLTNKLRKANSQEKVRIQTQIDQIHMSMIKLRRTK